MIKILPAFFFLPVWALLAACSNSKADPTPALPPATYAEGNAAPVALAKPVGSFITVAPSYSGNQPRRAVVVNVVVPNGNTFALTFSFLGSSFPAATGPVALDATVQVASGTGTANQSPTSTGLLTVDSVTPQVVSGVYTGPLLAGGPTVTLTFTKLAL